MKRIAIEFATISAGQRRMLTALGELFGVSFEQRKRSGEADAYLVACEDPKQWDDAVRHARPCYVTIRNDIAATHLTRDSVRFCAEPSLPCFLRNREIASEEAASLPTFSDLAPGVVSMATKSQRPIWGVGGPRHCRHHFVAWDIPALPESGSVCEWFDGDRFLALLPLLTFLREITEDGSWEPPPLQACLMFDDPNLHWPRYGYIDFAEIIAGAKREHYHVCIATIPLDAWFVHNRVSKMFREHPDRISLLMHGNDHTSAELAANTDEEQSRLAQQALTRIERMELRSGLAVSRVMAPPHGACSEAMLARMALAGYEAASISRGSLRHHNPSASWAHTVGMRTCDVIRDLPVLPRFRLSSHCHNSILVAAILRQPIIAVGHHYDLADGIDLLADLARFINGLGDVGWRSMSRIVRCHYSHRREGNVLHVKMHTRSADLIVPDGVGWLELHWPQLTQPCARMIHFDSLPYAIAPGSRVDLPIPVTAGQHVSARVAPISYTQRSYPRFARPWALVRRTLTEGRDRIAPNWRRIVSAFG
jgi:hypothetical protein